ncbi:hypothetical protein AB0J72_44760 [Dactylosporangium sp. NPDC049742]|uniref:hypothetical protein n=1 Tax=Dactylosporangium sp. NPDC049742 TaxID=3154737 RepID=UPI003437B6F7
MLPEPDNRNVVDVLPAVARWASGSADGGSTGKRIEAGRFEVWICAACGYTEWYALQVNEMLAWLSRNTSSGVHYYDADSAARPAPLG